MNFFKTVHLRYDVLNSRIFVLMNNEFSRRPQANS